MQMEMRLDASSNTIAAYRNPWHQPSSPKDFGPLMFETDVKPTEYHGFLIYHRHASVWEVVKDGVCITQRAGMNGAKRFVDMLNGPTPAESTVNRFWYDQAISHLSGNGI